jgi:hypothetical protein
MEECLSLLGAGIHCRCSSPVEYIRQFFYTAGLRAHRPVYPATSGLAGQPGLQRLNPAPPHRRRTANQSNKRQPPKNYA